MTEAFAALRLETEHENARNAQEHTKKGCIIYICVLYLHDFTCIYCICLGNPSAEREIIYRYTKGYWKQKPLNLEPGNMTTPAHAASTRRFKAVLVIFVI